MRQYLVLDIGGTFIKYALMGEDGSFLESGKLPSPMDSLDSLLAAVASVGEKFRGRYEKAAVSMPGRIDTRTGMAHTGGAFPFIRETPAGQLFAGRLGCPVTVANDGKCAANAEAWTGALADTADGAVLVLGTGTGGGIVLNPRIWMGHTFAAGELSFLPVRFEGLCRAFMEDVRSDGLEWMWAQYASAAVRATMSVSRRAPTSTARRWSSKPRRRASPPRSSWTASRRTSSGCGTT